MGVRMQHLVMYGVKITQEEAESRFGTTLDDDECTVYNIPAPRTGYKITEEDKFNPVMVCEDGMSGRYVVIGRIFNYANDDDGQSLPMQVLNGYASAETAKLQQQTLTALRDMGFTDAELHGGSKLSVGYIIFTHHR